MSSNKAPLLFTLFLLILEPGNYVAKKIYIYIYIVEEHMFKLVKE